MSNGKFAKRKGVATKMMFMILAVVLIVGISVGGTLAWLTATTTPVVNTFTVGDIGIKLEEHAYNPDDTSVKLDDTPVPFQTYPLIPGTTYFKDPTVTVLANSEDCYLFVKFEEDNKNTDVLTYTSNLDGNGWTKLADVTGVTNVWYREVDKSSTDVSFALLKDNKVTVPDTLTKALMPAEGRTPKLTFTAAAIQKDNTGTAAEAYAKLPDAFKGSTT